MPFFTAYGMTVKTNHVYGNAELIEFHRFFDELDELYDHDKRKIEWHLFGKKERKPVFFVFFIFEFLHSRNRKAIRQVFSKAEFMSEIQWCQSPIFFEYSGKMECVIKAAEPSDFVDSQGVGD